MAKPWEKYQEQESGPWDNYKEPAKGSAPIIYGGPSALASVLRGAGDFANTAARGAAGGIMAGLSGAIALGESPERMGEVYNQVADKPMFNRAPTTPVGQSLASNLGKVGEKVDTFLTDVGSVAPGGPVAQTALKTAVLGPLELMGAGPARQLLKGATPSVRPPHIRQSGFMGPIPEPFVGPPTPSMNTLTPQIGELYRAGGQAFDNARRLGSGLKPEAMERGLGKFSSIKGKNGLEVNFNEVLHPQAVTVRSEIIKAFEGGDVSFDKLMELREMAGEVAGNADSKIAYRGMELKNRIDDFVDSLGAEDMVGGNVEAATAELKRARKLWRDASAASTIQRQINLAEIDAGDLTGGGLENKLRIKFRELSRRIEKGHERGFTPDEVAAIRRVAEGGSLENVLRYIGKYSMNHPIYAMIGGATSYALGGPGGVAALLATGQLSRYLSGQMTIRNASGAQQLARSGGLLNTP